MCAGHEAACGLARLAAGGEYDFEFVYEYEYEYEYENENEGKDRARGTWHVHDGTRAA